MANSAIIKGRLQSNKKIAHGIRKVPPSFCETMRENLQIFPVPTAIPKTEIIIPNRDENISVVSSLCIILSGIRDRGPRISFFTDPCQLTPIFVPHPVKISYSVTLIIDSLTASTRVINSFSSILNGGIRTTTFPNGRRITFFFLASIITLIPILS